MVPVDKKYLVLSQSESVSHFVQKAYVREREGGKERTGWRGAVEDVRGEGERWVKSRRLLSLRKRERCRSACLAFPFLSIADRPEPTDRPIFRSSISELQLAPRRRRYSCRHRFSFQLSPSTGTPLWRRVFYSVPELPAEDPPS